MWTREGSKLSLLADDDDAHSLPFLYSGASMNGPSLLNSFLPPSPLVVILPGPVRIPAANGDRTTKHKTAAKTTAFDSIVRKKKKKTRFSSKLVKKKDLSFF